MKKLFILILILFLFSMLNAGDLIFDGTNAIKTGSLVRGLVGHWSLSEQSIKATSPDTILADLTPYNNEATNSGASFTADRMGIANRAMDFNGTTDYISITDTDNLSFGDGTDDSPFSISAWVNMDDATNFMIASKGVLNTDAEWIFYIISDDKLRFRIFDESVTNTYEGRLYNTALTSYEGIWIHLVGTYDGRGGVDAEDGMNIYLNGVAVDDNNASSGIYVAIENLDHDVWIGRYSSDYVNGKIDEVRIYNRVLSQTEITQLYHSYRAFLIMSGE